MGGYSSEYAISLKTGSVVYKHLNSSLYTAYKIHIFKEKWVCITDDAQEFPVDKNDFSVIINDTKINFDCVISTNT